MDETARKALAPQYLQACEKAWSTKCAPATTSGVVDLLSLEDCEPIVREVTPLYRRLDAARTLVCLMSYYRPCKEALVALCGMINTNGG